MPHKKLGWIRRQLLSRHTQWKDGFEVSDGPDDFEWLGERWFVELGAVRGLICKVGMTAGCREPALSRVIVGVGNAAKGVLGDADPNLSDPSCGGLLWVADDGTVIVQVASSFVAVYLNSLAEINKAIWANE